MKWEELDRIDLNAPKSTAGWAKALGLLRSLAVEEITPEQRDALADRLDEFADNSFSIGDSEVIERLDRSARKMAQALRLDEITQRIDALAAATADFKAAAKKFESASALLNKQAAELRADKVLGAIQAVDATLASLRALAKAMAVDTPAEDVKVAIDQAAKSVQSLQVLQGMLGKLN
jgi:hypothetical protein